MAIEEDAARDIDCAGPFMITVVGRCRRTARLRDRHDPPTRAPGR